MFKRHALSSARGVRGTAIALPPPTSRPALTRRPRPWVRTPRFTVAEGVNGQNLVKTSVQRGIRGAPSLPSCCALLAPVVAAPLLVGRALLACFNAKSCPLMRASRGEALSKRRRAVSPQPSWRSSSPPWRRAARWRSSSPRRTSWWWPKGALSGHSSVATELRALTPPPRPPPAVACSANHVNLVVANNQVLFFNIRDGPYFPTLRVLHKCKWLAAMTPATQSP